MRRMRWQDNGRAAGVALAGLLLVATAASLFGSSVFGESATFCGAVALDARLDAVPAACTDLRAARVDLVWAYAIVGVVVVVLSLATADRRWWVPRELTGRAWPVAAWAVITPLFFVIPGSLGRDGQASTGVDTLQHLAVCWAVLGAWAAASTKRSPALRDHLLAAAALTVPGACVLVAVYQDRTRGPFGTRGAAFPWSSGLPVLILAATTVTTFAAAVLVARCGRRAPNVWVSAAVYTVGVAAVVAAFVPDLVPAWRGPGFDRDPGRDVWLPLLLAPVVLATASWAVPAVQSVSGRGTRVSQRA